MLHLRWAVRAVYATLAKERVAIRHPASSSVYPTQHHRFLCIVIYEKHPDVLVDIGVKWTDCVMQRLFPFADTQAVIQAENDTHNREYNAEI